MSRLMALPIIQCDDCGDEIALCGVKVCPPCIRAAELRRRQVEQWRQRHHAERQI